VEPSDAHPVVPHMRLDELLAELQVRLQAVLATRDRTHALLEAVMAVGGNLELDVVLRQIVEAAVTLVNARYGALGIIGDGGRIAQLVPVGLDEAEIGRIHHWPQGRGLLGELITNPRTLRLPEIAEHPRSYGFPDGHPPMRSFLGVPIRIRDEVYGNLYLTEKQGGSQFDEEDEALLVALAAAAGVAIDNARLYEEARRQQGWLRANAEVTQRLLSGASPDQVLTLVTQRALQIAGADLVTLALPESQRRYLVIEHATGDGADKALGLVLPAAESVSGLVMATGKPKILHDFSSDDRIAGVARKNMRLGPAVLVPLGVPGNVRGVLTAGRCRGAMQLAPAAVDMVITFAAQAGVALELAEHRRDAEHFAVLEDRDRIARDLHDLVIQRLYATGMSLEGTAALLPESEAAGRVSKAVDALDDTIKQIRSAIFALHSRGSAEPPRLRGQILEVVAEMTSPLGFTPALRMAGGLDEVPAEVGEHLLSALREALSNAVRHANASQVDVRIEADRALVLVVTDNGSGMQVTRRRSGLANLAERAAKLSGTLRVGPAGDGGTQLEWQVPLADAS
jgi:two-component system, NarL family, sensor histidine kinase DevS